jgi:hypothetical protein
VAETFQRARSMRLSPAATLASAFSASLRRVGGSFSRTLSGAASGTRDSHRSALGDADVWPHLTDLSLIEEGGSKGKDAEAAQPKQ